jgi:predicted phosphodiesterase
MSRIAVISDLHSNAAALHAALTLAEARGFDTLMILGDLLTYGCDPQEVLDMVGAALSRGNARLVPGNHDQLYFDLAAGDSAYFNRLPDWLRETVEWTQAHIDGAALAADFPWEKEVSLDGIFFAHANPFAYGDWTYLNGDAELDAAMAALRGRGERIGVFGHTHRGKIVTYPGTTAAGTRYEMAGQSTLSQHVAGGDGAVADPGSLGQPRGAGQSSSLLFIETDVAGTRLDLQRLDYDVPTHVARIHASGMSDVTKHKLLSYFA